ADHHAASTRHIQQGFVFPERTSTRHQHAVAGDIVTEPANVVKDSAAVADHQAIAYGEEMGIIRPAHIKVGCIAPNRAAASHQHTVAGAGAAAHSRVETVTDDTAATDKCAPIAHYQAVARACVAHVDADIVAPKRAVAGNRNDVTV